MDSLFQGRRAAALLLSGALCLGCLSGCGGGDKSGDSSASGSTSGSGSVSSAASSAASASASQSAAAVPAAPAYDFGAPAPESAAVDPGYFADAAFVGDSRTEGFYMYSGVKNGDLLSSVGLSVYTLFDKKAVTIEDTDYTLLEALALKTYSKVYLCFGVNELGYPHEQRFHDLYCEAIDAIRACQPNAIIYTLAIVPVCENLVKEEKRDYLNNDRIRTYNALIQQAAAEKQAVYVDLYSAFVDENGGLPEDSTSDGVHLRAAGYVAWLNYLETHTVPFETLYPNGVPVPVQPAPATPAPDASTPETPAPDSSTPETPAPDPSTQVSPAPDGTIPEVSVAEPSADPSVTVQPDAGNAETGTAEGGVQG